MLRSHNTGFNTGHMEHRVDMEQGRWEAQMDSRGAQHTNNGEGDNKSVGEFMIGETKGNVPG